MGEGKMFRNMRNASGQGSHRQIGRSSRRSAPPVRRKNGLTYMGTLLLCLLGLSCGGGTGDSASRLSPSQFYGGETLRMLTSNSPGGGFDFYLRTTAKHLEKVTGIRVAAENVEGAGGTLGDNKLFFSPPDGLTIGLINFPGHVFAQLQRHPGVQYDFRQWEWLGRVAGIPPALAVASASRFDSIEDLMEDSGSIAFGLEGRGSDAYYGTVFLANVLGIPAQKILGYSGPGEIAAAMMAGEVEARFESIDTLLPLARSGEIRLLLILDNQKDTRFPEVPIISDLQVDDRTRASLEAFANIYKLERSFVAPPGTSLERVRYLRDALWQTWNSPEFQGEVNAAGRGLQPMNGETLEKEAKLVAGQIEVLGELIEEKGAGG